MPGSVLSVLFISSTSIDTPSVYADVSDTLAIKKDEKKNLWLHGLYMQVEKKGKQSM